MKCRYRFGPAVCPGVFGLGSRSPSPAHSKSIKDVYLVMMCWQVSGGGQATLCLPFATGSIFPPVLFLIEKNRTSRVFKYRLFQSQRVNLGQCGAQDIRPGMRAYAGDHRVPEKSGLGRAPGVQVEISFMVKWKRVYTLTKAVLCGPDKHMPRRKECKRRTAERKRIFGKVENFGGSQSIRMKIQPNSQHLVPTALPFPWVN